MISPLTEFTSKARCKGCDRKLALDELVYGCNCCDNKYCKECYDKLPDS